MGKTKRKSYAEQAADKGTLSKYYVGLDVAQKKTQVCILDENGKIVREKLVNSRPKALEEVMTARPMLNRSGLKAAIIPVGCIRN